MALLLKRDNAYERPPGYRKTVRWERRYLPLGLETSLLPGQLAELSFCTPTQWFSLLNKARQRGGGSRSTLHMSSVALHMSMY